MNDVLSRVVDNYADGEIGNKTTLEKMNMAVIKRVYQRLKDDDEVRAHIRQIQAHPGCGWWKGK